MCKSCTDCETNWCDGEDKIKCRWLREIASVVTTTEADIRAKVISELLEKTERNVADFIGANGYLTGADHKRILYETAEQLKKRGWMRHGLWTYVNTLDKKS